MPWCRFDLIRRVRHPRPLRQSRGGQPENDAFQRIAPSPMHCSPGSGPLDTCFAEGHGGLWSGETTPRPQRFEINYTHNGPGRCELDPRQIVQRYAEKRCQHRHSVAILSYPAKATSLRYAWFCGFLKHRTIDQLSYGCMKANGHDRQSRRRVRSLAGNCARCELPWIDGHVELALAGQYRAVCAGRQPVTDPEFTHEWTGLSSQGNPFPGLRLRQALRKDGCGGSPWRAK